MEASDAHPPNANAAIVVSVDGDSKVMLSNELHMANALRPIPSTQVGMQIANSPEQEAKASLWIIRACNPA
jgi:hypothetical protein